MERDEHGRFALDLLDRPRRVRLMLIDDVSDEPFTCLAEAIVERGESLTFHFGEDSGLLKVVVG